MRLSGGNSSDMSRTTFHQLAEYHPVEQIPIEVRGKLYEIAKVAESPVEKV